MRKIAHIINPVAVSQTSDLYMAQPVTFESMLAARRFAEGTVEVEQFTAQYPEDHAIIPEGFVRTEDLDRSVLDFGTFRARRKLPLIADVLSRLYETSDAELFVYTNVDIALMPHFYVSVKAIIDAGLDAFIVNRRTLLSSYQSLRQLPFMYADIGDPHPGCDCFVFKRSAFPDFVLNHVCIGAPKVGVALAANMACNASRFGEVGGNTHMTFHLGDGLAWANPEFDDYAAFNANETERIREALASRFDGRALPSVSLPALRQFFDRLRARHYKDGNGT